MSRKTVTSFVVICFSLCLCIPAQNTSGTIGGRVLDPTGAVIPNAEVKATNDATGTTVSARTNASRHI